MPRQVESIIDSDAPGRSVVPITARLCSTIVVLSLLGASFAHAQIRSATITGTVTDPTKAVVPGATVVLTEEGTNVSTELVTPERASSRRPTSRQAPTPFR